jgi:zinc protease
LSNIVTYDLPDDFIDEQNRILREIEKPEIDALAAEYMPVENMILVVVGDKSIVLPGLAELDFPIVELDEDANPL